GELAADGGSPQPGTSRGTSGRAHSDQEVGCLVGAFAGRAEGDLRREVSSHRDRARVPACDRAPPLSQPRAGRTVRLPDLVRVRRVGRRRVREARGASSQHGRMAVRGTRGRSASPAGPGCADALTNMTTADNLRAYEL